MFYAVGVVVEFEHQPGFYRPTPPTAADKTAKHHAPHPPSYSYLFHYNGFLVLCQQPQPLRTQRVIDYYGSSYWFAEWNASKHRYVCVYVRVYVCVCVCVRARVCVRACVCMFVRSEFRSRGGRNLVTNDRRHDRLWPSRSRFVIRRPSEQRIESTMKPPTENRCWWSSAGCRGSREIITISDQRLKLN